MPCPGIEIPRPFLPRLTRKSAMNAPRSKLFPAITTPILRTESTSQEKNGLLLEHVRRQTSKIAAAAVEQTPSCLYYFGGSLL